MKTPTTTNKRPKDFDKYRQYVRELCNYIRTEIYHGEYTMDLAYTRERELVGNTELAAEISIDQTYLQFTITFYGKCYSFWEQKRYEDLARIVTHEMCHLITEPLYLIAIDAITNTSKDLLEDVRERQTQRIANVVFDALPKDVYTPKKNKK